MFDSGKTDIVVGDKVKRLDGTITSNRATTAEMRTIIDAARKKRAAEGKPALAYHDASLYLPKEGGSTKPKVQGHHIIPVDVAKDFEKLFNRIKKESGGRFVFDQNHADNLVWLPVDGAAISAGEERKIYAVQHNSKHDAYSNSVREILKTIQDDFADDLKSKDPKKKAKAAETAVRRVEAMTHGLLNGLVSDDPKKRRFFLQSTDRTLIREYSKNPDAPELAKNKGETIAAYLKRIIYKGETKRLQGKIADDPYVFKTLTKPEAGTYRTTGKFDSSVTRLARIVQAKPRTGRSRRPGIIARDPPPASISATARGAGWRPRVSSGGR